MAGLPSPTGPGAPGGRLRLLELYCGIGGCAAAVGDAARVVGAVDIDRRALAVHRHNFPRQPTAVRTLESLSAEELAAFAADLWWMSPPASRSPAGGSVATTATRAAPACWR